MGKAACQFHDHQLDVSSLKNLAVDISARFGVNVKYGFRNHPQEMLPLYDPSCTGEEGAFIVMDVIRHPTAKETFWLYEEDYLEKRLYEKYGDDIVHTKEFRSAYSIGGDDVRARWTIEAYRSEAEGVTYCIEPGDDSLYEGFLNVFQDYAWNELHSDYEWNNFCYHTVGENYDDLSAAYGLTVYRLNMLQVAVLLGGSVLYVVPEYHTLMHEDLSKFKWMEVENLIVTEAGKCLVELSGKIKKVPMDQRFLYLFTEVRREVEQFLRGEISREELKKIMNKPRESDYWDNVMERMRQDIDRLEHFYPAAFRDDFEDLKQYLPSLKGPIEDEKSDENPGKILWQNIREGRDRQAAHRMAMIIDLARQKVVSMPQAQHVALSHILACAFAWAGDYEQARKCHAVFLANDQWRKKYNEHVEGYLLIVFAKDNRDFIHRLLEEYPFIKTEHSEVYNTYLAVIVHPHDSSYYFSGLETNGYWPKIVHCRQLYASPDV